MQYDEIWQTATTYVPSFETCKSLWDHGIKLTKTIACYVKPDRRETYELNYFFPDGITRRAYQGEDIGWHAYPAPFAQDIFNMLYNHYFEIIFDWDFEKEISIMYCDDEDGSDLFNKKYKINSNNLAEHFANIAIDLAEQGLLTEVAE